MKDRNKDRRGSETKLRIAIHVVNYIFRIRFRHLAFSGLQRKSYEFAKKDFSFFKEPLRGSLDILHNIQP